LSKPSARQERILAVLRSRGSARVAELAREFDVSPITLRRDVEALARDEQVVRSHGVVRLPSARRTDRSLRPVADVVVLMAPLHNTYLGQIINGAREAAEQQGLRWELLGVEEMEPTRSAIRRACAVPGVLGALIIPRWRSAATVAAEDAVPLAVAAFLDEVGRGDAETARAIDRAQDLLEGWYRGDGWYSDGDGRAFDHYIGWAMHLYPVLVAHLRGDTAQLERLGPRLEEFLGSFAATFDVNGAPLHQGRSLTYRTAALAAVALGEVVGWTPLRPGQTRRILSAGLRYFLDRGALTDGIFSRGWHGPHAATLQTYSGPASPYWASKGFVGLLLPETAPLWTAVEEPPPSAGPDRTVVIPSVGWLVQTTEADGMVRVHNHGSDHLNPWDADGGEPDPLYARLAYSTRTGPTAVRNAPDNHIALHVRGRESVRRRIHPIGSGPDWVASWHRPQFPGSPGPVLPQGRIESLVVARGAWEVHVHRLRAVPAGIPVTVTGWALAATSPQDLDPHVDGVAVALQTDATATRLIGCHGFDAAEVQRAPQGTAYGPGRSSPPSAARSYRVSSWSAPRRSRRHPSPARPRSRWRAARWRSAGPAAAARRAAGRPRPRPW
jgi:hypothetical protein